MTVYIFRVKQHFWKNTIVLVIYTEIRAFNQDIFIPRYLRKTANTIKCVRTDARAVLSIFS